MIKYDKIQKLIIDDLYKEKNEWQVIKDEQHNRVWCLYKGVLALTIPDKLFFVDIEKCNNCTINNAIVILNNYVRLNEKHEQVKHISYMTNDTMKITILESDNIVSYCNKRIFDIIGENKYRISSPLESIILDDDVDVAMIFPIRYVKE